MEPKMSDFLQPYGSAVSGEAYLRECPQGSHIKMLPYDKQSSKWMHQCILRHDPQVFRDHRQAAIVCALREAKYFLVALPSSHLPEQGVIPPILGYCICSEDTVQSNEPTWLRIISVGVLSDNRRMGIATRLIRQAASFHKHPLYMTIDPGIHAEMACLWKKRGAVIEPMFQEPETAPYRIYRFTLTYSQLFTSQKFVKNYTAKE